jgi:phage recombination protein Bet
MTPIEMDKVQTICKKWKLKELNFTKGVFIAEDNSGITVNLREEKPIIGVTIAGTLYTEGHGNLRVPDLEAEIMNALKPFLKPTKKPVRIDETSQSSINDKKAEVKDDSHKIVQRKSDDQINVTTRPQEQTTKGGQESSFFKSQSTEQLGSNPPTRRINKEQTFEELHGNAQRTKADDDKASSSSMSGKSKLGTPDKLQKAKCKDCNLEFEITLDNAQKMYEDFQGMYCPDCLNKTRTVQEDEKENKKKETKIQGFETRIRTCIICDLELSGARTLECFQRNTKETRFICEECEEKSKGVTNMDEKLPVSIETENENKLTVTKIKQYICPTATDAEAYNFLQLCVHRDLNPFLKEAYLIKYGTMPATMVVGKDAFTKKAEESGKLDGFEAGIIVKSNDGKIDRRIGVVQFEGDTLIGGWAKIFRKDMKYPFVCEVPLSEYMKFKDGKPQSSWAIMPGTMIRKVALVQALREAFTKELGGCYDAVEMGAQDNIK